MNVIHRIYNGLSYNVQFENDSNYIQGSSSECLVKTVTAVDAKRGATRHRAAFKTDKILTLFAGKV